MVVARRQGRTASEAAASSSASRRLVVLGRAHVKIRRFELGELQTRVFAGLARGFNFLGWLTNKSQLSSNFIHPLTMVCGYEINGTCVNGFLFTIGNPEQYHRLTIRTVYQQDFN